MLDNELLEEYRAEISDRYTPLEICELFIEHFDLSEMDILDIFGDEKLAELKWR